MPHGDAAKRIHDLEDLLSRYVNQMLHGCGNPDCRQALCENGRKNATGKPIRRYTPRSARAIALTLASSPRPRKRLCIRVPDAKDNSKKFIDEGGQDPSSVIQVLADTMSVRAACVRETSSLPATSSSDLPGFLEAEPNSTGTVKALRNYDSLLDNAETALELATEQNLSLSHQQENAQIMCAALYGLIAAVKPVPDVRRYSEEDSHALDKNEFEKELFGSIRIAGRFPSSPLLREYIDNLDDPRYLRRLERYLSILGRAMKMDPAENAPQASIDVPSRNNGICGMIADITVASWRSALGQQHFFLASWLMKAFHKHWTGSVTFQAETVSMACLRLLQAFATRISQIPTSQTCRSSDHEAHLRLYDMDFILARVNALDAAQAWLHMAAPNPSRPYHLLEFGLLLSIAYRAECFRTMNHLRMQRAHNGAQKASALRNRAVRGNFDVDSNSRLKFLEDHYLLLNVGRDNIIQDSFNQVWQRRHTELLRPLRVRLGEMDEMEIGHDLGGVQIEFFNLLCKEAFSEKLGMFDTDAKTGLSYFRPGCLQPLYMFELLGLLFALAIYNGITLPVSLPLAFYARLLDVQSTGLQSIRDGWPAMYRSLSDILNQDIPGLEHVFALEANGVRLSISSFGQEPEREEPKMTARVVEASAILHSPQPSDGPSRDLNQPHSAALDNTPARIDIESLDWPGWSFEAPASNEPVDINSSNRLQYVHQYVDWLTYAAVAAQWHHFLKGFHRILSTHHLRIFSPAQLQSITEGTKTISIPNLRRATEYEGFSPESTYIATFWSLVASWSHEKQKNFLKFVTAAERVPLSGAGNMTFKISRASHPGAEDGLPTSSTCFGTLYLPRYQNREVLDRKLEIALEMGGEGFGTG